MEKLNQYVLDHQAASFRQLKVETGYPVAEIMRRMFDHCFQDKVLNAIFPSMSGRISVESK